MNKFLKRIVICSLSLSLILSGGCSKNVLETIADKNTDDALFTAAKKSLDEGSYASAITSISGMSTKGKAGADVQTVLGSAYAGKCGFNFINFFTNLSDAGFDNINFFTFTMQAFTGTAVSPVDCTTAIDIFNATYPNVNRRPTDVALMMTLLGLAKMGTYVRNKADLDGDSELGDGIVDTAFNACNDFTSDEVGEITTGLGVFLINFLALGNGLFGGEDSKEAVNIFAKACNLATGGTLESDGSVTGGACTKTSAAEITAGEVALMRDVLQSDSFGLGQCNEANAALVSTCCP